MADEVEHDAASWGRTGAPPSNPVAMRPEAALFGLLGRRGGAYAPAEGSMHGHSKADAPKTLLDLFRVPIVLAIVTVALGTTGFMLAGHAGVSESFDALYHSLQLLLLHGVHSKADTHVLVQIARFTGAASLGWTGIVALFELIRRAASGGHAVICGLGDLGLRLALEARDQGLAVIAIEKGGDPARIAQAKAHGITIVRGDAKDQRTLRRAKVEKADVLVAVCGDDATNETIVIVAASLVSSSRTRTSPLICRLLIRDPSKRKAFADLAVAAPSDPTRVRILADEVDLEDAAARQALRDHPLDFRPLPPESRTTVHLVVIGFGPVGRAVALHAARIGHFGNGAETVRRIRLTVVATDAEAAVAAFRAQNGGIDAECELAFRETDGERGDVRRILDEIGDGAAAKQELLTFAFCREVEQGVADPENLHLAAGAAAWADDRPVQLLAYRSRKPAAGAPAPPGLRSFGSVEEIFAWDVLIHERDDAVARALHEDYRAGRSREVPPASEPSWAELPANLKDSNRQAADHIPIKLRAFGYHAQPVCDGRPGLQSFTTAETELLAKLEHRRWCAERTLTGWTYGPRRDRDRNVHPSLVPWDKLNDSEREKDREQVRAIPRALARAGLGIYR